MSWEQFEHDFPRGAETSEFGFMTPDQLRANPDIGIISVLLRTPAKHMTIQEQRLIYDRYNDHAICIEYDVNDSIKHAERIKPLSPYGAAMMRDYLNYNYIPKN